MKVEEISERVIKKKLTHAATAYSLKLGMYPPKKPLSWKNYVIKLSAKYPVIKAAIKYNNGRVTYQNGRDLIKFMIDNPVPGLDVAKYFTVPNKTEQAEPTPRANPKISRRKSVEKYKKSAAEREDFYKTWEWKKLRYSVIQEFGPVCMCCGARKGDKTPHGEDVRIVVDHIKPISKFWHLRLDRKNLQVLCDDCNMGKSNTDYTDFRRETVEEEVPFDFDDEIDAIKSGVNPFH